MVARAEPRQEFRLARPLLHVIWSLMLTADRAIGSIYIGYIHLLFLSTIIEFLEDRGRRGATIRYIQAGITRITYETVQSIANALVV